MASKFQFTYVLTKIQKSLKVDKEILGHRLNALPFLIIHQLIQILGFSFFLFLSPFSYLSIVYPSGSRHGTLDPDIEICNVEIMETDKANERRPVYSGRKNASELCINSSNGEAKLFQYHS